MEFESVIKMRFPCLAAVIYDENPTVKDSHPSRTDDVSCLHNLHHKPRQNNLDRSHLPPVINSTHDLHHKNLTSSVSNTTSNHFIQNLNIVPCHFDMQPHHTYEISSKETFRSIMPSPCNETFETYFHSDQALIDIAYTTSPTVGSNVLHVSHENTMWGNDQNQGFVLETESTFNLAMVNSNLFDGPKPNEDTIMNRRGNNQVMLRAAQIKKNRRLMRRMCRPMKKHIIIKGQWTSQEDR